MAIQWTEDLATGISEIDEQHRELFDRINKMLTACQQGRGRDEVGATVSFLEDYVDTHFATEERNMVATRYPGYSGHRSEHDRFTGNLKDLKLQLMKDGPGIHIIILTNHIVVEWLRTHIRTRDKAFGAHVRSLD